MSICPAWGQAVPADAPPASDKAPVLQLERFTVTGSNIQMTAADADKGALPVDIVSAGRFQLSNAESFSDFMRNVPTITGGMNTVGNVENSNQGQTLNLRGFGANYTLVLVDGRRFAGEGVSADVSTIPANAIESIEILKGGASAIYGTDAVAGVVNIKLKHEYEGAEVLASYGNTTNKDAGVQRYALTFGQKHDKLSIVGSAEWQRHNSIYKFDRGVTKSRNWTYLGGNDKRNGTYTFIQRILGLPSAPAGLIIDPTKFSPGQTSLDPNSYVAVPAYEKQTTSEPEAWPAYRVFGTNWNLEYQVFDRRLVLFSSGFYQDQTVRFQFQPPIARVSVAANNPFNPFGLPVTVAYAFGGSEVPGNGPALNSDGTPHQANPANPAMDINDTQALSNTFGAKGTIGQFNYELSYSKFHREGRQTEQGDIDQTKAQAAVNAGTFNPFGYWANSPTLLGTLIMNPRQLWIDEYLNVLTAKVTGSLVQLPAGALRFAVGAENRSASWGINFDEGWRTINTLFHPPSAGNVNSSRSRSVNAYFGELRAPLWQAKDSGSFLTALEVSGAERKETYSRGKSVSIPQGSLRAAFLDDSLVLRASYSESFRAPTLANLNTPVTTTLNTISTVFDPVRGAALPFNLTQGGNPNLKPESGKNYDVGLVYTPKALPALTLKADYWNIKIEDVIVTPSLVDVMNGTSPVGSLTRDANLFPTINITISNAGEIAATGYDFGATYRMKPTAWGNLTFDLNGTYTNKFQSHFGSTITDYLAKVSNSYGEMPKLRAVFGVFWQRNQWEAALFLHQMSGATEPLGSGTRHVESYSTGDLQVSYNFKDSHAFRGFLRNTKVVLGVDNFWDEALPFVDSISEGWDRTLADFRGRYIYLELRKKL
ncbi:MAG TPA: TonB-dependent receptor [Lacunisphaera sp.]|nr:TonB-dependent receptor [Lacunisphaera sp.]